MKIESEDIKKNISTNITKYREKANLSQKELATKLNTSPSRVSNWEQGNNCPSIDILFDVCRILDVSINDIYGVYPTSSFSLSYDEQDHIKKYRSLDPAGQNFPLIFRTLRSKSISKVLISISYTSLPTVAASAGDSAKSIGLIFRNLHIVKNSSTLNSLSLFSFARLSYRATYGIFVSFDILDMLIPVFLTYSDNSFVTLAIFSPTF